MRERGIRKNALKPKLSQQIKKEEDKKARGWGNVK